eukprot:6138444-Amphidinium_carterae.1
MTLTVVVRIKKHIQVWEEVEHALSAMPRRLCCYMHSFCTQHLPQRRSAVLQHRATMTTKTANKSDWHTH